VKTVWTVENTNTELLESLEFESENGMGE